MNLIVSPLMTWFKNVVRYAKIAAGKRAKKFPRFALRTFARKGEIKAKKKPASTAKSMKNDFKYYFGYPNI